MTTDEPKLPKLSMRCATLDHRSCPGCDICTCHERATTTPSPAQETRTS
jgi:hypothetical protein